MISKINSRGMEKSGRKRRIAKKKKKKSVTSSQLPLWATKRSVLLEISERQ